MLKLIRIFKKLLIIVGVAIAIYSAIYDIRKVEASSIDNALNGNGGWDIKQEKDKLTDISTIKAYKNYSVNGAMIEVVANCIAGLDFIEFDFNALSDNENTPITFRKTPIKDTINTSNGMSSYISYETRYVVYVGYRLDKEPAQTLASNSNYNNVVSLVLDKKIYNSKVMIVRLPLPNGDTDMEIQLSDLQNFFNNCPDNRKIKKDSANDNENDIEQNSRNDSSLMLSRSAFNPSASRMPIGKTSSDNSTDGTIALGQVGNVDVSQVETKQQKSVKTSINGYCKNSKKSTLDVLICSDNDLLALNSQLNSEYHKHMQDINEYAKSSFKAEQIEWNKSRSQVCNLQPIGQIDENESKVIIACLKDMYKQRLAELETR